MRYIVYTRVGDGAFDNGTLVEDTVYTASIAPGQLYSYKVTAVNKGGERASTARFWQRCVPRTRRGPCSSSMVSIG